MNKIIQPKNNKYLLVKRTKYLKNEQRTNINQLHENVKSVFEYCYVEIFRVRADFFLFYLFFIIIFIFEMAVDAHIV